ncbi:MAG: AtpZ/AtpI family protein [Anaerolineae bacterium]
MNKEDDGGLGEALRASTLGWEMALPMFIGALLGRFLDQRLETGHTFTVGLLFAGAVAGFYNVWRYGQRQDARRRRRREREAEEQEEKDL